jgi:hypothetical protein
MPLLAKTGLVSDLFFMSVNNTSHIGVLLAAILWFNAGCGHDGDVWKVLPSNLPPCIVDIARLETEEPFGFLAEFIVRYNYDGEEVYYIFPSCADCYGYVLDEQCEYICSPELGRNICKDFFGDATDGELIWCLNKEVCSYAVYALD